LRVSEGWPCNQHKQARVTLVGHETRNTYDFALPGEQDQIARWLSASKLQTPLVCYQYVLDRHGSLCEITRSKGKSWLSRCASDGNCPRSPSGTAPPIFMQLAFPFTHYLTAINCFLAYVASLELRRLIYCSNILLNFPCQSRSLDYHPLHNEAGTINLVSQACLSVPLV